MNARQDPPSLTVIVPVKAPDPVRLARCILSFAALPSADSIELVVVRTGDLSEFPDAAARRLHSTRIVEVVEPGIYHAYNAGIRHARGRFLLFFGHDDIALPGIEDALRVARSAPVGRRMIAAAMHVEGVGSRRPSFFRQGIIFRNWGHQAILYEAGLLDSSSYDPRFPLRADHAVNIALLGDHNLEISRLKTVVAYFTRGGFSSHFIVDPEFDRLQPRLAARAFGEPWGLAVRVLLPLVRVGRKVRRMLNPRPTDAS